MQEQQKEQQQQQQQPAPSAPATSRVHHRRRRRVCLFGTSANPPTGEGGHLGIVKALSNLNRYDEIRVLPVYQHMFSSKRNQLVDYNHRIAMCQLNFENNTQNKNVIVSNNEQEVFNVLAEGMSEEECQSLRVGTADLLDMLLKQEPDTEFSFCLGADTFVDLTKWKWKRSKDVLKLLDGRLVVLYRKGITINDNNNDNDNDNDNDNNENSSSSTTTTSLEDLVTQVNQTESAQIELLHVPTLGEVSSSAIRSCNDENILIKMLHPNVLEYIKKNQLYAFNTTTK